MVKACSTKGNILSLHNCCKFDTNIDTERLYKAIFLLVLVDITGFQKAPFTF